MIRFACPHCSGNVRVTDAYAGRTGRCPFCKGVVVIPIESQPSADGDESASLADLAAALNDETHTGAESPAPAPPEPEDAPAGSAETEPELVPSADPRYKTTRLDSIDIPPQDTTDLDRPEIPPAPAGPARPKRSRMWIAVGGGGAAVAAAVVAVVFVVPMLSGPKAPGDGASTGVTARQGPQGGPAVAPPGAQTHIPLATPIALAASRAPADVFAMFHVDLARLAGTAPDLRGGGDRSLSAVAGSRLWVDAPQRVREGAMPASVTLYLSTRSDTASAIFGRFYGLGYADASAGLWSLTDADRTLPHFLVRVSGKAAKGLGDSLLAAGRSLYDDQPQTGPAATFGPLRVVPAADELLVGTTAMLDADGKPTGKAAQQQVAGDLLEKVETDRAVVGLADMDKLRGAVGGALARSPDAPAWVGPKTRVVFSIDPSPSGEATLVVCDPAAPDALKAQTGQMTVRPDGPDLRITGPATEAIPLLAGILPGFEEILLAGLDMAQPVPPPAAKAPEPKPEPEIQPEPEPQPQPKSEPKPEPAPDATPAVTGTVRCMCFNPDCPTKGKVFEVDKASVPPAVLRGAAPLTCPRCKQPTAVVTRKCPHCGADSPVTLPTCIKCEKPIE